MSNSEKAIEPRRKPKQVRAELTRTRIISAAAHIFAEYGYAAGTTNRIAAQAGISIGSLYQYYPNKGAILAELVTQHIGDENTNNDDLAQLSLQEALRALVGETIRNHSDEPELLRVMIEHTPLSSSLREKLKHHERQRVERVRRLLDQHSEIRVDDAEMAARLIVSTIELVTHQMMAGPEPADGPRLQNELVTMIHRYLTPTGTLATPS